MKILILEDTENQYISIKSKFEKELKNRNIKSIKVNDFIYNKHLLSTLKLTGYDIIFVDYKLWDEDKDGYYYGKILREQNPEAFIVLVTGHLAEIKSNYELYPLFNKQVQKEIQKGDIIDILDSYENFKRKLKEQKLITNFYKGPKNGRFAKDEQYKVYYLDLIKQPENLKAIENNAEIWFNEIEKFIKNPFYKVPAEIVNEWKANEEPFSKRAHKKNATKQLFQNILTWRRIFLELYETGRQKNLPDFVEHREMTRQSKTIINNTIKKYSLKNQEEYNFVCLKSIYVLYAIHTNGKYSNSSFDDKHKNHVKAFISTCLGFSYKTPYIQYDYNECNDIFNEEETYFKDLGFFSA